MEERHLLDKHREVPDHNNIKNHRTHPYILQEGKTKSHKSLNLAPFSGFHAHTFTILSKNPGHTLSIPVINDYFKIKGLDMTRKKIVTGPVYFSSSSLQSECGCGREKQESFSAEIFKRNHPYQCCY